MTSTHYPTDLTIQCSVGKPVTLSARTFITRQTSQVGDALNYQRYVLHSQVRVSMANAILIRCHRGKRSIPTSESGKLMVHGL